ncbi:hypothetical protein LTR74_003267 [Friedmanniomyces endolithicus]|nr:hypothetical protein LTR74_003267 [Friedmanniomyces endolithicus]
MNRPAPIVENLTYILVRQAGEVGAVDKAHIGDTRNTIEVMLARKESHIPHLIWQSPGFGSPCGSPDAGHPDPRSPHMSMTETCGPLFTVEDLVKGSRWRE